jgi:hypothetical protein
VTVPGAARVGPGPGQSSSPGLPSPLRCNSPFPAVSARHADAALPLGSAKASIYPCREDWLLYYFHLYLSISV